MAENFGQQELLEREISEIADRERERLGRELHDGLCQSLAGIAAMASALSKSLAANPEPGPATAANEIARLLHEAIGQARDLARSLGPIDLNGAESTPAASRPWRATSAALTASPAVSRAIAAVPNFAEKRNRTSCGSRRKPCATRSPTGEPIKSI